MSSINRSIAALIKADVNNDGIRELKAVSTDRSVFDNKTYTYTGVLSVNTGTRRIYMPRNGIFGTWDMFVKTAPTGADVAVNVLRNGSTVATGTITAGATSSTNLTFSTRTFASGDYYTVDITQVGSSTAGEDLYINFRIVG